MQETHIVIKLEELKRLTNEMVKEFSDWTTRAMGIIDSERVAEGKKPLSDNRYVVVNQDEDYAPEITRIINRHTGLGSPAQRQSKLPDSMNVEINMTGLNLLSETYRRVIGSYLDLLLSSLDFAIETIDQELASKGFSPLLNNRYHVSYTDANPELQNQPLHIVDYVKKAHENARGKGWWQEDRSFAECLVLCHSELSEALEDIRNGHEPDKEWYECSLAIRDEAIRTDLAHPHDFIIQNNGKFHISKNISPWLKPCGVPSELADAVIRIFDMAGRWNIDLERAINEKMAYNETRPTRHGGKVL